jgi:tRNA1Val (adenine37-N6)-methyltransferase
MDIFKFKAFDIYQDRNVMRVNTDGVLLAAWASASIPGNILDVGSGTGVISLIMAQRYPKALIKAIDIDQHATKLSNLNFQASSWSARLEATHVDLKSFTNQTEPGKYNFIISNPPFFNNSTKSLKSVNARSKHTLSLSHESILECSKILLSDDGEIAMILPEKEALHCLDYAESIGYNCLNKMFVYPDETKEMERILFKLSLQSERVKLTEEKLFIREGNPKEFSQEYKRITKAYYLNF